jgi:DNA-binding transcriptional ArsR family regulator
MEGKKVRSFDVLPVDDLTLAVAKEMQATEGPGRLVRYERSSPQARTLLRDSGIPFVGEDGEVYLHNPPIHIELSGTGETPRVPPGSRPAPFAPKASRISRWLLLNAGAEPSFRQLSDVVELSESVVSRTIAALGDLRLVEVEADHRDARVRRVRVPDSGALLSALADSTRGKQRSRTWDIGARTIEATTRRVRMASRRDHLGYALGGLAGASLFHHVVEPVEAEIWIDRADYARWLDALTPTPARRGPGRLTVSLMPDPYPLSLTSKKGGLLVADPVQLYLDCHRSGERALEAADAIRSEMGW